ncbi:MAG: transcriptional regulator [Desulfurococcales archaeon]|nr:transcriptional regulator [Desulfurococcales archaeon]
MPKSGHNGGGVSRIAEMPCELAAREIIPSIRAALAIAMVKKGASRYRVASLLGLTPAAVTYYVTGRRGGRYLKEILADEEMRRLVERVGDVLLGEAPIREKEKAFKALICYICSRLNRYECSAPFARDSEELLASLEKEASRGVGG